MVNSEKDLENYICNNNDEFKLNDISNDLLILNKTTIDTLFKLENCSDCISLYIFYYKTTKWQKTNIIKATDNYVMKCLKWSSNRLLKIKKILKENGLINIIQRRNNGKISGWYIEICYLLSQKNEDEVKIKVEESKNLKIQELENSRTCNQETNALKEYIICLKKEIEMLKEKLPKEKTDEKPLPKEKKFVKPTYEEVKKYCNERKNTLDAEEFIDFYESKDWMIGKNKMKDWKACIRTWEKNDKKVKKEIYEDDDGMYIRI